MRERGRRLRGGDSGEAPARAADRQLPNRLTDEAVPNVLTIGGAPTSNARPSWVRGAAARAARRAQAQAQTQTRRSDEADRATAEPVQRNPPSWGAIIFTGLILFSLARACLQ